MRAVLIVATIFLLTIVLRGRDPQPGSDAWLTNAPPSLPAPQTTTGIDTNRFVNVKAEAVAGKLLLRWETAEQFAEARIIASADAPGHWPARDWRTFLMRRIPGGWLTEVPVDSLDVPIIYFVVDGANGKTAASPMRIVFPRALGLEEPTRLFWPFIEGFEQGTEGWRAVDGPAVRRDAEAKSGRASLAMQVPSGRRSTTLVTTRFRGWFLEEHGATGIALWLRMKTGTGTARFALSANAFSTNQLIARRTETVRVTEKWTRALLPFSTFPKLALGDVDLFSVELTAAPGAEFLIDDVRLAGRWPLDF
jgi:hypothetical protein